MSCIWIGRGTAATVELTKGTVTTKGGMVIDPMALLNDLSDLHGGSNGVCLKKL